jgi:hypothetical protein
MSTDLQPQQTGPDRSRLRALVPVAVFDIAGPLAVYWVARLAGTTQVTALILSGIVPAAGIVYGVVRDRRVSLIGVLVLAGIVTGTMLGLLTHDPRLVLLEGSVPTLILGVSCLVSLWRGQPLVFRLITEAIGAGTRKGRLLERAFAHPAARQLFARITLVWGLVDLAEVAARIVIVEAFSTSSALLVLKLMPYLVTVFLLRWTMQTIHQNPVLAGLVRPATAAAADRELVTAPR